MTRRKLKKLARGVLTGRTKCRHCDTCVRSRNPVKILIGLGQHIEDEHPELTS